MPTPPSPKKPGRSPRRSALLIAAALAALPAGYLLVAAPHPRTGPLPTVVDVPPDEPPQDTVASTDPLPDTVHAPESRVAVDPIATEGTMARPAAPWDGDKPPEPAPAGSATDVTAAAAPPLPEIVDPATALAHDPGCLPSLSAVRRLFPEARPSWTMRASDHERTKCWFAAAPRQQADSAADARPAPSAADRRKSKSLVAVGDYDPACLPSASAVRQTFPEARPSWTMWAPGHEGTQCWYATRPRLAARLRAASAPPAGPEQAESVDKPPADDEDADVPNLIEDFPLFKLIR